MIHLKRALCSLILLFFFNAGFSQNKPRSRKAQDTKNSSFYITENETNDVKVAKLGQQLQNAIIESNTEAFMQLFDTKGFGELVTASTKNDKSLNNYRANFLKGFDSNITAFPKKIINEVETGSYYDFVNYSYDNSMDTYYMLFRIYSAETGINYHFYRVSIVNNNFSFNDIYVYLTGEALSKTLERFYLYALPKKSLFDFFGENNADEFIKLAQGVDYYNKGDFKNAYDKIDGLKGDLKDDKFVLVIKSVCASNINDALYKNSIKNIMDKYPDDATLYLSQIDYHILTEDYDMALFLFEKLKQDTDDSFLNLMMGNVEFQRERYEKALSYFEVITQEFPDFFDGYSSKLSCLSLMQEFEECIGVLDFLVKDGYDKTDIIGFVEEIDVYNENILKDLATSEAFKNWKKL